MKYALTVLVTGLIAAVVLGGCGSDGSFSFSGSSGGSTAGSSGSAGGSSSGTGGSSAFGSSGSSVVNTLIHTPEPTTVALLGSGLLAYALMRRRKRR